MRLKLIVPSLLLVLAIQGCVTGGRDFNTDTTWIKKNGTTQSDMRTILKEPAEIGNADQMPTWTYLYYHYPLIGTREKKELKIWWNKDGTVNTFAFTSSFPEDTGAKNNVAKPQSEY